MTPPRTADVQAGPREGFPQLPPGASPCPVLSRAAPVSRLCEALSVGERGPGVLCTLARPLERGSGPLRPGTAPSQLEDRAQLERAGLSAERTV